MKGLNVKKLAAIGLGAALLGTALAPMVTAKDVSELTKSDIIGSNGSPIVSIVGGSNGASVSDYVWAGNIAVRVAQLATTERDVVVTPGTDAGSAEPTGLLVDVSVGGTSAYSTESSYTYDTNTLESGTAAGNYEWTKTLTDSQLKFLQDKSTTYKLNGTSYTQKITESIGIQVDAKFDTDNSTVDGDLIATAKGSGDFNYTVQIQDGLPPTFTSGDTNKMDVYFFGSKYKVQGVTGTSGIYKITLMKDAATKTYYEGSSITGLEGRDAYAGKKLTVTFDSITETSSEATYKADFSLYDDNGTLIDTYQASVAAYLNDQFVDSDGDYPLKSVVYIETISLESTNNKGKITVTTGSDILELKQNAVYPYSSTDTKTSDDYWKIKMSTTTQTNTSEVLSIYEIAVVNNDITGPAYKNESNAIYAGDDALHTGKSNEFNLLDYGDATTNEGIAGYNFAKMIFDGWKNSEPTTVIKIGGGTLASGGISYYDNGGVAYTGAEAIPFYLQKALGSTGSFDFVDETFYYACSSTDPTTSVDFNVTSGTDKLNGLDAGFYQNGAAVDVGWFWTTDGNVTRTAGQTVDFNGVTYTFNHITAGEAEFTADGNCTFASEDLGTTTPPTDSGETYLDTDNLYNTFYYGDSNTHLMAFRANPVTISASSFTDNYEYAFYVNETRSEFWLLLDSSTNFSGYYNADVGITGTDTDEDGAEEWAYYLPDTTTFAGAVSNVFFVANFQVAQDGDSSWDANVAITTANGKPVSLPNSNLSWWAWDVNVFAGTAGTTNGYILSLDSARDPYITKGYTEYGTKITTDSTESVFTIPQNQEKLKFVVAGEATTTSTTGGEALIDLAKGDQGKTTGGTTVTIDDIKYTAGVCGVGDAVATPSKYTNVMSAGNLVYDDTTSPAGAHIIMGGYKVNELAVGLSLSDGTSLEDTLTQPGDYVAELLDNGDIVVAGYTADDTETAAKKLISALDQLVG